MRVKTALLMVFLLGLLIDASGAKDVFDHRNLQGLQKVNEIIVVDVRVSGDEPFDLEESKVKDIVIRKLREAKIQIDSTNKANANIMVKIQGETTGGGGARLVTDLILFSRVSSPFGQENNIPVVVWNTETHDEQVMSYDPEKKKLVKVRGKLNERAYAAVEAVMTKFQADHKKAKLK
jgi:hypothetical protein